MSEILLALALEKVAPDLPFRMWEAILGLVHAAIICRP